ASPSRRSAGTVSARADLSAHRRSPRRRPLPWLGCCCPCLQWRSSLRSPAFTVHILQENQLYGCQYIACSGAHFGSLSDAAGCVSEPKEMNSPCKQGHIEQGYGHVACVCRGHRRVAPTNRGKELNDEKATKRLHLDRADDRGRDHRYSGGRR